MSRSKRKGINASKLPVGKYPLLGMTAILLTAVIMAIFFAVYVKPPNKQSFAFQVTDAAAIHKGEDVRVAGVVVGKVTDVTLLDDAVEVRADIDDNIFVGDKSTVSVKMLTPVGGYAVTLNPSGRNKLSGSIPPDRVTVPYSIGDVIQEVPRTTEEVEASTWKQNIGEVADALEENDTSLRSIVTGLDSVSGVLARQRDQVHTIAELAADYLASFEQRDSLIFEFIRKLDSVITSYHVSSDGFNYAYRLFSTVLYRLGPTMRTYLVNSDYVDVGFKDLMEQIRIMESGLTPLLDSLTNIRDGLKDGLGPEAYDRLSEGQLMLSDICIPLADKRC